MNATTSTWMGAPDRRTARVALFLAVAIGGPLTIWKTRSINAPFEHFLPLVFLAVCSLLLSVQALRALAQLEREYPEAHQARTFVGTVATLLPIVAALTIGGVVATMR